MRPKKIVIREPVEVYNLVASVNTIGLEATARKLDCDPTTLSRWLNTQGYEMTRRWELSKAKRQVQHAN